MPGVSRPTQETRQTNVEDRRKLHAASICGTALETMAAKHLAWRMVVMTLSDCGALILGSDALLAGACAKMTDGKIEQGGFMDPRLGHSFRFRYQGSGRCRKLAHREVALRPSGCDLSALCVPIGALPYFHAFGRVAARPCRGPDTHAVIFNCECRREQPDL